MTEQAPAVDLFAGPGGLDASASQHQIPVTGIEHDANACATRRAAGLATVQGDVRDYGPADFPEARALLGGPPCQTFTLTGNGSGRRQLDAVLAGVATLSGRRSLPDVFQDERTGLVLEPLRWALEAVDSGRPYRTIVLEQVPAVLPVWHAYAAALRAEGYTTACGVLSAEQYGVPQTRRRAVLVASLDRPAALPAPTHRAYRKGTPRAAGAPGLRPWVSMGDVLDRPEPFTVVSNYGTGGDPKARGRRTSNQPAATVTGKIDRFRVVDAEGVELGRLTPAEIGVLQTFPADWPWSGQDTAQQAGNAVPPLLGQAVLAAAFGLDRTGRHLAEQISLFA